MSRKNRRGNMASQNVIYKMWFSRILKRGFSCLCSCVFLQSQLILKGKAEVFWAKFSQNMEVVVHTSENTLLVLIFSSNSLREPLKRIKKVV